MTTGNEVLYNKYVDKIENIINNNKEKRYLKGFYNYMGSKLSITTKYDYMNYVVNFMNYCNKKLSEIELDDYTGFLSTIDNKTPSYQIGVYSGLKKFSKYLMASNKNPNNYMEYIDRPNPTEKQNTITKREKGYLDDNEIKIYMESVRNGVGNKISKAKQSTWKERDLAIVVLFLNLGLRCSALYKLDIDNVDFDNQILITTEKRNVTREYDLSNEVCEILLNWVDKREEFLGNIKENALFISDRRSRMDNSSIYRVVNKYAEQIENKNITPHKLRATYGTQLYNQTKDLYFVQDRMGHTNPKTTELYIRGQKSNNGKRAADIMSSLTLK